MYFPMMLSEEIFNNLFRDDCSRGGICQNTAINKNTHRHCKSPMKFFNNHWNVILKTDIKENEDNYELKVEIPGIKKENIKLELNEGYLSIDVERNSENEEKSEKDNFIRKEIYEGQAERTFYVEENVTEDNIKARLDNGILNINMPKIKEEKKEEKKLINIE